MEQFFADFAAFMWGTPLIVLLVGGGLFFVIFSKGLPYRHFPHAINVLRGKYAKEGGEGQISHYQALTTALSGTLGLGNIAGVAIAISIGGPGAIFWMWVTAVVGVATKFYTCTLAVMYRGYDSNGQLQGGPMYVIREGLGKRWMPLAVLFALAGMCGALPVFQINQLVQIVRDAVAIPSGITTESNHLVFDLSLGIALSIVVWIVLIGNIQRIGKVTAALVPVMVVLYMIMTIVVLAVKADQIPNAFYLIFHHAFTPESAASGTLLTIILTGVRRGAFSNEAGIGTEAMAHGAAKTNEPVREGVVAMVGPVVDTLLVCTCTALVVLVTGAWQIEGSSGVTLTAQAFESVLPGFGAYLLTVMVLFLSLSTVFTFGYYGSKCLGFLIGANRQHYYIWMYTGLVILGATVSLTTVVNLIDAMYALMAIPTMVSTILLAGKVNQAAKRYFATASK
ncbi:alanine/glycine:cation symporter family protein [Sessilibacter corallicola]|uniref:alanine/glycine:cation symporter family protein n=1 Tax=Sessilibacter corallicola TaxID=2904075 RepID=UPI001E51094B|nr:amino acid carrier protein [Sessilibacter corallicola]MCE2029583.1 alanine:cation symporter family protein [Sessilibacter corallicola]